MIKRNHLSLAAVTAAVLLTVTFGPGPLSVSRAQDNLPLPPAPPIADRGPLAPEDGGPGPGPRGERPPPHLPRPDADQPPAPPVDPQAASAAVKTASNALAGLSAGQVWTRTAPRGEQQVQATLMFQNKEVARLEFDPANGSLLARGQRPTPPTPLPGEGRGPGARPNVPPAPAGGADKPSNPPMPPTPDADGPHPAAPPVNLDPIKAKLPDTIKGLSTGQGAEIMPGEGFWKVPLIFQNRVVGELRLSGDGTKIIEDFGAARDAAIFAR
jgi:hypothetical protein